LLEAVEELLELDEEGKRSVPDDAPVGFVPAKWGPHVLTEDGKIERRHWELCLLWQLRGALRSGDVWVEGARRYANPQGFLVPKDRWPELRGEVSPDYLSRTLWAYWPDDDPAPPPAPDAVAAAIAAIRSRGEEAAA